MSPAPEIRGADGLLSNSNQMLKNCWSCRVLTGGGLILSGAYVYSAARKIMARAGHSSIGVVAQITFAAGLATWGVVILTDPVGKSHRKGEAPPSAGQ